VGGQLHASAALPPGKTEYTLFRRLGWLQGRSGRVQIRSPDRPARSELFLAVKGGQWVGLETISPPRTASLEILEASNSWGSRSLSMPVMEYLYL